MIHNQETAPLEEEDLRAALEEMKTYIDVTEEDLKKIYEIALRHARQRMAAQVPVKDLMTTAVIAIRQDEGLHEAARLLSENKISGMPVIDDEKIVIGVISEADLLQLAGMKKNHTFRDILRKILGEGKRLKVAGGNRVEDFMSSPALTIDPLADVKKAATLLDEHQIKRLPVVNADGKLVGIISRGDIVRAIGKGHFSGRGNKSRA